jgi:integrase
LPLGLRRVGPRIYRGALRLSATRKEAELNAWNNGVHVTPDANGNPLSLTDAVRDFREEKGLQRKSKTHADYATVLRYFQQSCHKQYRTDITRKGSARIQRVLSRRTRAFAACDDGERLWFEFFLMTGMREQEVMHVCWKDIKFADCVVRVSYKPDRGWTPKAYKERQIPVPAKLMGSLKKLHAKSNGCPLVFPTSSCNPKLDFLDCCKAIAGRAKLKKSDFWLHKFRATFATWSLWAGVDLRTVQQWLGHSDMESTMRAPETVAQSAGA